MTADFIIRTEHAELKLTTDGKSTQEDWDTLTASLTALYPVAVSESARTATKLLDELDGLEKPSQGQTFDGWSAPLRDKNYHGPADPSIMGMRLFEGDTVSVTEPASPSHQNTHRWTQEIPDSLKWLCVYTGCTATATLRAKS